MNQKEGLIFYIGKRARIQLMNWCRSESTQKQLDTSCRFSVCISLFPLIMVQTSDSDYRVTLGIFPYDPRVTVSQDATKSKEMKELQTGKSAFGA